VVVDGSVLADAGVSERETEVLALLGDRLTHAEIGARLFISARTVESHVASLRRKLGAADRRALVRLAADYRASVATTSGFEAPRLPAPLTSFVGRSTERAALTGALTESRLVSVVGPGGVGKTRLALAVAAELTDRFPGGTWYVDLVPVVDPAMVAPAVAAVLGAAEAPGRPVEQSVVAALADRRTLLLLDNCEHLVNTVAVLVERLLSGCPGLVVLVTSRSRLVVAFERVYRVAGLSLPAREGRHDAVPGDACGDAVALFVDRASAAGASPPPAGDLRRIASICRTLDGMPLAIELAAARLPSLGLDGLESGMSDHLGLLTGGERVHTRHRSLQETLDWSCQLLDPLDRAVLRRVSLFAAPFDPDAAATVAGFAPVADHQVRPALARLADQSLLVTVPTPRGTRYRMLETIRQHGAGELQRADDHDARRRHLAWCLATAHALRPSESPVGLADWRTALDAVADDMRAALGWSASRPEHRADAHRLAYALAHLLFVRGRAGEAQQRYEQAAELSDDPGSAAGGHAGAAAVAKCRVVGNEALCLDQAAARAALRGGDHAAAAVAFARSAELIGRFSGMFAHLPPPDESVSLLAAARANAHGDQRAEAAILTAETSNCDPRDPLAAELAERAIQLTGWTGDPLLVSAALDMMQRVQVAQGDVAEAAATAARRVALLAATAPEPATAFELKDALHTAVFTHIGAGDLAGACRYAEQQLDLPFLHEEHHLANEELLAPDALTGRWDRVRSVSIQFRESWERDGRPRAPGRGIAPCAVAMVHGLRGEPTARAEWLAILAAIRGVDHASAGRGTGYGEAFDAIVDLHHGHPDQARQQLAADPLALASWYGPVFHQWYLALRAEAAVLAGHPDAPDVVARARLAAARNPVASGIVRRAHALMVDDRTGLLAAASSFQRAGCPYQRARTLVLAGGHHRTQGQTELHALGAAPPALRL
jgi:predicted ATPase/DNA-binding CsgD family transcriptional regulator